MVTGFSDKESVETGIMKTVLGLEAGNCRF
jgi:hypothetical protein